MRDSWNNWLHFLLLRWSFASPFIIIRFCIWVYERRFSKSFRIFHSESGVGVERTQFFGNVQIHGEKRRMRHLYEGIPIGIRKCFYYNERRVGCHEKRGFASNEKCYFKWKSLLFVLIWCWWCKYLPTVHVSHMSKVNWCNNHRLWHLAWDV